MATAPAPSEASTPSHSTVEHESNTAGHGLLGATNTPGPRSSSKTPMAHLEEVSMKQSDVETHATLKRSAIQEWFSTTVDAIVAMVPLFFLVITVLCLRLNGQAVSLYGQNLKAITLLSPTIFPIVYAAILGKVLRRVALFKAERSSTIGTLEQLTGSQSFFASIERQFGLRRINGLGLLIMFAWLLSPLGGQSSLRLLTTQPSQEVVTYTPKYHSIDGFANDTRFDFHMNEYTWTSYGPIYMTALQTARQIGSGPRDLFGNVRIPDIRSLTPETNSSQNLPDWHTISDKSTLTYTSLFGLPILDLPASGNVSFTVESSYWETQCGQFKPGLPYPENDTATDPYQSKLSAGPGGQSFSLQWHSPDIDDTWAPNSDIHFEFNYLSKTNLTRTANSSCTAWFRMVESEVFCKEADCSVQRMRHLDRDAAPMFRHMSKTGTPDNPNWSEFFWGLCEFMPGADMGQQANSSRSSELVESWMMNPNEVWGAAKYNAVKFNFVDLSTLAPEVFDRRLQMAMNTFWDATLNSTYRVGNLTSRDLGDEADRKVWTATEATGKRFAGDEYVCNTVFAALTIIISGLLFLAAVVSVALGLMTRAPDVLGYVSTLARDDPYFEKHVPSHLDGLEATRALRKERVILGDVHKEGDVGHVAFASVGLAPDRVSRKRLYD